MLSRPHSWIYCRTVGLDCISFISDLTRIIKLKSDQCLIRLGAGFQDELVRELKQTLSSIKLEEKGVYVQASTLGSLEALLEFLRTSKVPVSIVIFCKQFY